MARKEVGLVAAWSVDTGREHRGGPVDGDAVMVDKRESPPGGPSPGEPSRPVALTARWIAAARAHESARPDHLFDDPFAEALSGSAELRVTPGGPLRAGRSMIDELIVQASRAFGAPMLAIRTRFFDEMLLHAVRAGRVRQVVLLAAGLDARAFRLPWPLGTHLYELDQPAVLEAKAATLARIEAEPVCSRHTLGVDLTRTEWVEGLRAAGYEPGAPSAWLAEGLLMYLDVPAVSQLLQTVAGLATPGSWLGADMFNTVVLTAPLLRPLVDLMSAQGAPWHFATDDPAAVLGNAGWIAEVTEVREAGVRYGRWPFLVSPRRLGGTPRYFLLSARRAPAADSPPVETP
jgi:methyltransferase (TIGR00027 family)